MFKELWWLIKKLFTKVEDRSLVYKLMKYFPFKGYSAMCWCGYLITRNPKSSIKEVTVIHENIHLKLAVKKYYSKRWIRFYASYLWWYLKGFTLLNPMSSAYYTIPYEMEAYANLHNKNYLNKVTKDSYKKYIIKHRRKVFKKHKNNWIKYLRSI